MLFKIAFRNVRRQIGGYLIYFFTVALTVAVLFSLSGLIFSKTVFDYSLGYKIQTIAMCVFLAIVLAIVSAIVLGYGCAFLLRRRKKEFGLYLTLGMTRDNIMTIFAIEMLFMFLFSLGVGIGLGVLMYQGIVAGVSAILVVSVEWADYSAGAFIMTIVLVTVIFLITEAVASSYLKKQKITDLLKGEKTKGKQTKRPHAWLIVAVVAFSTLVLSVTYLAATISRPNAIILIVGATLAVISVFLTYLGALKCATHYLLKNKKFSGKGVRTFTLRQLSDRTQSDSMFFGVIAVLLSIVVAGGNLFMTTYGSQAADCELSNPYTVNVSSPYVEGGKYTEDLPNWMQNFGTAEKMLQYTVFEVEEKSLSKYLRGDPMLLRESDYYTLAEMADEKSAPVNGGALMLCNGVSVSELNKLKKDAEELIGKLKWVTDAFSITFNGVSPSRKSLVVNGSNFMLVVPDNVVDAVENTGIYKRAITQVAVNYKKGSFDEEKMNGFFSKENMKDIYSQFPYTHGINMFFYAEMTGSFLPELRMIATPWLMLVLFLTLATALLSMAVMALKCLAAVAENKKRFRLLYLVGASERQTFFSLFVQTALYFLLPFAVPIFINIPMSVICIGLNELYGGALTPLQVIGYGALFMGALLLVYLLYCLVTCLVGYTDVKKEMYASGSLE